MSLPFYVIIPARLKSTRLPHKLLQDLAGMTVLERTYHKAQQAHPLDVIIATDSTEIKTITERFGANTMLTHHHHMSGTDRIAEVICRLSLPDETIIVNLQGDEPFMPGQYIHHVAQVLAQSQAPMATLSAPITTQETFQHPHVVKVIVNRLQQALYFSRSPIPYLHNTTQVEGLRRHLGIYAYRASFLKRLSALPPAPYEQLESLEQLRALWHGFTIQVGFVVEGIGIEINTDEDLKAARLFLQSIPKIRNSPPRHPEPERSEGEGSPIE